METNDDNNSSQRQSSQAPPSPSQTPAINIRREDEDANDDLRRSGGSQNDPTPTHKISPQNNRFVDTYSEQRLRRTPNTDFATESFQIPKRLPADDNVEDVLDPAMLLTSSRPISITITEPSRRRAGTVSSPLPKSRALSENDSGLNGGTTASHSNSTSNNPPPPSALKTITTTREKRKQVRVSGAVIQPPPCDSLVKTLWRGGDIFTLDSSAWLSTLASPPVELSALLKSQEEVIESEPPVVVETSQDRSLQLFADCRFPVACLCTIKSSLQIFLNVFQFIAGLVMFFVAVWFSLDDPDYLWVGEPFWHFALWAGCVLVSPPLMALIMRIMIEIFRWTINFHVDRAARLSREKSKEKPSSPLLIPIPSPAQVEPIELPPAYQNQLSSPNSPTSPTPKTSRLQRYIEWYYPKSKPDQQVQTETQAQTQEQTPETPPPPPPPPPVQPSKTKKVSSFKKTAKQRLDRVVVVSQTQINALFEALFFAETMRPTVVRTSYLLIWLISFALIFTDVQQLSGQWQAAYQYTNSTLGSLALFAAGQVFTVYITLSISREVSMSTLGPKVRNVLTQELSLWRMLGAMPLPPIANVLVDVRSGHLLDDPRTARRLAHAVQQAEMRGMINIDGEMRFLSLSSDRDGRLMGNLLFRMMLTAGRDAEVARLQNVHSSGSSSGSPNLVIPEPTRKRSQAYPQRAPSLGGFSQRNMPAAGDPVGYGKIISVNVPEKNDLDALDMALPHQRDNWYRVVSARYTQRRYDGILVNSTRRFIKKSDLEALMRKSPQMSPWMDVSIEEIWSFFDPESTGLCSMRRARDTMVNLVRQRRNLRKTLDDAVSIVQKLQQTVAVVVNLLVGLGVIAIYGLNVTEIWVAISSIVLAFTFIFGGAGKTLFESSIFVLSIHPYDVGDLIKLLINGQEIPYYVKKISLLTTTLMRWDGAIIKFPNATLSGMTFYNLSRSSNFETTFTFKFDAATLPSKREFDAMQAELEQFLMRNRSNYTGECSITARNVDDGLKIMVTIWVGFAFTESEMGRINREKSRCLQFIVSMLRRRGLVWTGLMNGRLTLDAKENFHNSQKPPIVMKMGKGLESDLDSPFALQLKRGGEAGEVKPNISWFS